MVSGHRRGGEDLAKKVKSPVAADSSLGHGIGHDGAQFRKGHPFIQRWWVQLHAVTSVVKDAFPKRRRSVVVNVHAQGVSHRASIRVNREYCTTKGTKTTDYCAIVA